MNHCNPLFWIVPAVLCLTVVAASPTAVVAEQPPASGAVVSAAPPMTCLAWSIDWRSFLGGRRRIVQLTVIALCVGILLLIKPTNRI